MPTPDPLDPPERLVLRLYADVLEGAPLEGVLGDIASMLGGETAFATRVQFGPDQMVPVGRISHVGFDAVAIADYASHWIGLDPRMIAGGLQPNGVINFAHLLPMDTMRRSAFWNEFAVKRAPAFHSIAAGFDATQGMTGAVSVQRPIQAEPFGDRGVALLQWLYPHLKRALLAELRLADVQAASLSTGFDHLRHGIAMVGPKRRLHYLNATLAGYVAARDGLELGPRGLRLHDAEAQRGLDDAIRRVVAVATGAERSLPETTAFHATRPSGVAPWLIQVLPLSASGSGPFGDVSGAILVITDTQAQVRATEIRLRETLGLSPAEAALAAALAQGTTLARHADQRGVSVETVRSQLAAIRRKTGCRRQAELVALVGAVSR